MNQPKKTTTAAVPAIRLTIRSVPNQAVPEAARLKRLLKALLRGYGFRCLGIEDIPPAGDPRDPAPVVQQREET
jgi:hypothetical protein